MDTLVSLAFYAPSVKPLVDPIFEHWLPLEQCTARHTICHVNNVDIFRPPMFRLVWIVGTEEAPRFKLISVYQWKMISHEAHKNVRNNYKTASFAQHFGWFVVENAHFLIKCGQAQKNVPNVSKIVSVLCSASHQANLFRVRLWLNW